MIEVLTQTTETHLVIKVMDTYGGLNTFRRLSFSLHTLDLVTADKYIESLVNHIQYVREAGEKLGVHKSQLAAHDSSKWSHEEFPYYALNFHGDVSPADQERVKSNFATAWLHHIHHNPHHWQHWVFPDAYTPKGSDVESGIVPMPNIYALEMIADWMGASKAYTGSWDMTDWLLKNMPKIKLHSTTAEFVRVELYHLGYADKIGMQRFGHEES